MKYFCGACGKEHKGKYKHCGACGVKVEKKSRFTPIEWGLLLTLVGVAIIGAIDTLSSSDEGPQYAAEDDRSAPSSRTTQTRSYTPSPQPRYETFTIRCTFNCKESGNFPGTQTRTWTGGATYTVTDTEYWKALSKAESEAYSDSIQVCRQSGGEVQFVTPYTCN